MGVDAMTSAMQVPTALCFLSAIFVGLRPMVAGQYLPVMGPRIFGREVVRQPVVMGPGMTQPVSMGPEMMQPGSMGPEIMQPVSMGPEMMQPGPMGPRVMQPEFMGPGMVPNIQMSPGMSSPITLTHGQHTLTHGQNIRSSYYGPEIITPSRQL